MSFIVANMSPTLAAFYTCIIIVSDIAIFVLKRDVKLQLTNMYHQCSVPTAPLLALSHNNNNILLKDLLLKSEKKCQWSNKELNTDVRA